MRWGRTRLDDWLDGKSSRGVAFIFAALTVSIVVSAAADGKLTMTGVIIAGIVSAVLVGLGVLWVYGFGKFVDRISVPIDLGKRMRIYLAVLLIGILIGGLLFMPRLLSAAVGLVGSR
ncbi:MAG TPA: hypothetical protein VGH02_10760 [Rhizomicrobium sp.]